MPYIVLVSMLALLGTVSFLAYLAVQAFRSEYLVVVSHYRGQETFFLERGTDGKYQLVPPVRVPFAVAHFVRTRLAAAVTTAPRHALQHVPGHPFRALHRGERSTHTAHV